MKHLAAILLLLSVACERGQRPAPSPKAAAKPDAGENLLDITRGAAVISRTGELNLEVSAVNAIDGDLQTPWKSAPASPQETLVFALPARARISRVGVIGVTMATESPHQVRFDASDDGTTWTPVATIGVRPMREPQPQVVDVAPFEASYLRVETIEQRDYYSSLTAALAFGREIAPRPSVSIDGCWSINGWPARFVQRGTSVAGIIGSDPPIAVSGGAGARSVRLMWRQGATWGYALAALDPRRQVLSGVRWYEQVRALNLGDGWLGTPVPCGAQTVDETRFAEAILQRAGHWMLYGDDALDTAATLIARAPSQRFAVVARDASALERVRAGLRSRGADLSRIELSTAPAPWPLDTSPQRAMADGVALQMR